VYYIYRYAIWRISLQGLILIWQEVGHERTHLAEEL
jgi:hypothetical protein